MASSSSNKTSSRKRRHNTALCRYDTEIIQLTGVRARVKLAEILRLLAIDYKSIIGIIRVADYDGKILDDMVFLYFTDSFEVERIINHSTMLIQGQLVQISYPPLMHATVKIVESSPETGSCPCCVLQSCPWPLTLMNLNVKIDRVATNNTIKILEIFELDDRVTGFRFAFCKNTHKIRSFGCLTLLKKEYAKDIVRAKFHFHDQLIDVKLGKEIPVIVDIDKKQVLADSNFEITDAVRMYNWLHANIIDTERPRNSAPTREIHAQDEMATPSDVRSRLGPMTSAAAIVNSETRSKSVKERLRAPPGSPVLSIRLENCHLDSDDEEAPKKKRRFPDWK